MLMEDILIRGERILRITPYLVTYSHVKRMRLYLILSTSIWQYNIKTASKELEINNITNILVKYNNRVKLFKDLIKVLITKFSK